MAITNFYKGFNTKNYEQYGGGFSTFNVSCIEIDLLNEIFTTRGERLYMPNYGTRIPILTFEPNDSNTMAVIQQDITNVINNDPRVILLNLSVVQVPDSYAILAIAQITYINFNVTKDLNITVTSK